MGIQCKRRDSCIFELQQKCPPPRTFEAEKYEYWGVPTQRSWLPAYNEYQTRNLHYYKDFPNSLSPVCFIEGVLYVNACSSRTSGRKHSTKFAHGDTGALRGDVTAARGSLQKLKGNKYVNRTKLQLGMWGVGNKVLYEIQIQVPTIKKHIFCKYWS